MGLDRGNWRQAMMGENFSFLSRKEVFSSTWKYSLPHVTDHKYRTSI